MKGSAVFLFIFGTQLFLLCIFPFALAENRNNSTHIESSCSQTDCLRCDLEAARCVKCLYVIIEDTRQCLRVCPKGSHPIWSRSTNVFGRTCEERSVLSLVSERQVGIIAGASVLGAICVGIFLGFLVLHKKGQKQPPDSPPRALPRSLQDKRPKTEESNVKGKEKEEFIARLRLLRSDAPQIFRMMAETRNRFKGGAGPDNPSETKTKACKAVVRDLSRVLCLLSRKEEHLNSAPKDWDRLLSWTERLLVRYKRQQEQKELETKGDLPANFSNSGRSLFLTRQQKVKEDRKRRIERKPSDENQSWAQTFNANQHFASNIEVFDCSAFSSSADSEDCSSTSEGGSIPSSPLPKLALTPLNSTESLLPSSPREGKRNKKKDLLNLNKQIWSKLITLKDFSSNQNSSNIDIEKGKDDLQINLTAEDIPSQTFFDHIESFAFDLEDGKFEDINESPKSNNRNKKLGRNDLKNIDSIWKEPFKPKKLGVRDMNLLNANARHPRLAKPKKTLDVNKENRRPSRIRRISSSLLRRDKKVVIPKDIPSNNKVGSKKRRPITRQKQVEKDKRSSIQEKLKKTSTDSCSSTFSSSSEEANSSLMSPNGEKYKGLTRKTSSVNQIIEGDDIYVHVTKTPVLVHRPKPKLSTSSTSSSDSQFSSTSTRSNSSSFSSSDESSSTNQSDSSFSRLISTNPHSSGGGSSAVVESSSNLIQIPKSLKPSSSEIQNQRRSSLVRNKKPPSQLRERVNSVVVNNQKLPETNRRHSIPVLGRFAAQQSALPRCEILTNV